MNSLKPLQDLKKFKFYQDAGRAFIQGINFRNKLKISISRGYDSVIFDITKKELNELIDNLSNLEKELKDE